MAGPILTSARSKTRAKKANGPIWSPKRSNPTTLWARTPPRSAWPFYNGKAFPQRYHGGAFIGMHGSWNRSKMVGYKVAFVPFENGKPAGPIEDILTGFIADESKFEAYGRPVGVTVAPDGSLLVADDSGGKVWRVTVKK